MLQKINIKEKFEKFDEFWSPKILGQVNDNYVKIFKAKGEFIWHKHENEDELFLVILGELTIKLRDKDIALHTGEFCIIPKGIEHMPVAKEECHVLLFEPKQVINTGDVISEKRVKEPDWI